MAGVSINNTGNAISQAQTFIDEAERQVAAGDLRYDTATQLGRQRRAFTERAMPQLQSQIAASGQFHSSNRKRDERFAATDFLGAQGDLTLAMQRQLNAMERARMYAAIGLTGY